VHTYTFCSLDIRSGISDIGQWFVGLDTALQKHQPTSATVFQTSMFASSVTTIGRPHALPPNVHFTDTKTLCCGTENGVLLEDIMSGHQVSFCPRALSTWLDADWFEIQHTSMQKHMWVSNRQGAECSVGQPVLAADARHNQIAVYQPGSTHIQIVSVDRFEIVDNPLVRGTDWTWLHMRFSESGLRLAAVAQAHCFILCIYTRQDDLSPFELMCTADMQSNGTPLPPSFFPGDHEYISFAGVIRTNLPNNRNGCCVDVIQSIKRIDLRSLVTLGDVQTKVVFQLCTQNGSVAKLTARHGQWICVHWMPVIPSQFIIGRLSVIY
jgi:hypothetical protein